MTTNDEDVLARGSLSEHLANERTFLAWIRTSIAMTSLGFVLAKFSVWLRELFATMTPRGTAVGLPPSGASLPAGLALMAFGALTAVLALLRHRAVGRAIDRGDYTPEGFLPLLIAVGVVGTSAVVIVYLLATSRHL